MRPQAQSADPLEAFLEDPVGNFSLIKEVPNLCDRIMYYDLKYVVKGGPGPLRHYLDDLYDRHFREVDEKKIEIALYLYKELRGCQGEIGEKTIRVFRLNPGLFVKQLEHDAEWRDLIGELSWRWEEFSPGLEELDDTTFEREVRQFAHSLNNERERNIELAADFVNDPVTNFERIKPLRNIGGWIYHYEMKFVKDGVMTRSPFDILLKHFDEIDERKMEILMFLLEGGFTGYAGELLIEKGARVFSAHPQAFLNELEKAKDWKRIVSDLELMNPGEFAEGMKKAGDTKFVKEIKRFLAEEKRRSA